MRDNCSHHLCYVCFLVSVDLVYTTDEEEGDVPAVVPAVSKKAKKQEHASSAEGISCYNYVFNFIYVVYKYV